MHCPQHAKGKEANGCKEAQERPAPGMLVGRWPEDRQNRTGLDGEKHSNPKHSEGWVRVRRWNEANVLEVWIRPQPGQGNSDDPNEPCKRNGDRSHGT